MKYIQKFIFFIICAFFTESVCIDDTLEIEGRDIPFVFIDEKIYSDLLYVNYDHQHEFGILASFIRERYKINAEYSRRWLYWLVHEYVSLVQDISKEFGYRCESNHLVYIFKKNYLQRNNKNDLISLLILLKVFANIMEVHFCHAKNKYTLVSEYTHNIDVYKKQECTSYCDIKDSEYLEDNKTLLEHLNSICLPCLATYICSSDFVKADDCCGTIKAID